MRKQHFNFTELILVCAAAATALFLCGRAAAAGADAGKDAVCMNNLKTIGAALASYTQSADDFIPYVDYQLGEGGNSSHRITWASALVSGKFLRDNAVYFCETAAPLFTGIGAQRSVSDGAEACTLTPDSSLERYRFIDYGINFEFMASNYGQWHSKQQRELVTMKMKAIKSPAEKVMIADAIDDREADQTYGRYIISPYASGANRINPCHNGSANILWSDGHATTVDKPRETIQKGGAKLTNFYFNGNVANTK